jgi:DNA-binding GntR family transcriptional regulator
VRARILDGTLPHSQAINQEALAANLGLSITPLREALRRLEAEGLLLRQEHKDIYVAPLTRHELHDLYTVRLQLEPHAAEDACESADHHQMRAVEALSVTGADMDPVERLEAHRAFHRAIYASSRNLVLVSFLDSLWERIDRYRVEVTLEEHKEIATAFSSRDAPLVAALVRSHVLSGLQQLEALHGEF